MNLLVPHGFEANYTLGFARGLAANGVDVCVVSDDDIAPRLEQAGIPHCNLRGSVDPRRAKAPKLANLARYYVRLLWMVWRRRGQPVHFTGILDRRMLLLDGFVLPLWFRLCSSSYIHTAHNALPHSREHSAWTRRVYRWVYRFPHHIVAHTAKVADQLHEEFGVPRERLSIISIGLNEEVPLVAVSRAEARRRLQLPDEGRLALFFGKIERYKGLDLLAAAWAQVRTPDARLAIVGTCPDRAYAQEVRQAFASFPESRPAEWRDRFVPNEEAALWLQAADVVVMPYRHIYQSGVVFLCLRFGVPIVATDVGSLADYIDAHSGIMAPKDNAPAFAAALDRFFAEPQRFDRADIAARAAKYRWDRQCAAITRLYAGATRPVCPASMTLHP